jgi:hypothetical protein
LPIDVSEYCRQILRCEGLVARSIGLCFEKLRQQFPEYLAIDSAKDTKVATARENVQEGERASNFELPGRKEQGATFVLDFEGRFTGIPDLAKQSLCPL